MQNVKFMTISQPFHTADTLQTIFIFYTTYKIGKSATRITSFPFKKAWNEISNSFINDSNFSLQRIITEIVNKASIFILDHYKYA